MKVRKDLNLYGLINLYLYFLSKSYLNDIFQTPTVQLNLDDTWFSVQSLIYSLVVW